MILAAHQAQYLPYPGVISKIAAADVFVLQDNLQFVKQEWQNRNRVRTPDGWAWLTIPVHYKSHSEIREVVPVDRRWTSRHWRTITTLYGRSEWFERIRRVWTVVKDNPEGSLSYLNERLLRAILLELKIDERKVVLQSSIPLKRIVDGPDERLIELCRAFGCNSYLSGNGAQVYMDMDVWRRSGISVLWQKWEQRPYKQMFSGWEPNLSILDVMMCVGDPNAHLTESRVISSP